MNNLYEKFYDLKLWCLNNGCFINDKLDISGNDENKYLITKMPVESNEKMLEINLDICLCDKLIDSFDWYKNSPNSKLDLFSSHEKLILILIHHKNLGTESFYYPYINFLPNLNDFSSHPVISYFNIDLESLDAITIKILNFIKPYAKSFDNFNNLLLQKINLFPDFKNKVTIDLIKWGHLIVRTRSWISDGFILVPMMDLFQHETTSQMINKVENGKCLMSSHRVYKSGEIIYDTYGIKDDFELYATYGFVNFSYNIFKLNPNIPIKLKANNLTNDFISKTGDFYLLSSGIQQTYFTLARLNNLSSIELESLTEEKLNNIKNFYSVDNELKSCQNILSICKYVLENNKDIMDGALLLKSDSNILIQSLAHILLNYKYTIKQTINNTINHWNRLLNCPFTFNIDFDL